MLAALVLTGSPAAAHNIETSYTIIAVRPDTVLLEMVIDEYDLFTSFDLDTNQDGILWRREMLAGAPVVFDFLLKQVHLQGDGQPLELQPRESQIQPDAKGNLFLSLGFAAPCPETPAQLDVQVDLVDAFGSEHKNLARIILPDGPPQQAVFDSGTIRQRFTLREPQVPALERLMRTVQAWFD